MKVLVACEYSGRVREAFRAKGHNAWSCDLLPAEDGSPFHLQCDMFDVLRAGGCDLLIAHPPCTYLTSAAEWCYRDVELQTKRMKPGVLYGAERRKARQESIDFVKRIMGSDVPRIAVENPVGVLSSHIGRPSQIIQPWWFGDDASKATCLWLKNLPLLAPTNPVTPRMVCGCGHTFWSEAEDAYGCPNCEGEHRALPRWGNQTDSGQNKEPPSESRWKDRSRTFQGIADAFANQWSDL